MKPETTEDILELMNGYIVSAVLGTAMELGIFWLLAEKPLSTPELAQCLNIPLNRCHYWLQILCKLGLLEDSGEGYAPSSISREAILNVQSQDTWAFQAREDRDLSLYVRDLALNISKPISAWQAARRRGGARGGGRFIFHSQNRAIDVNHCQERMRLDSQVVL
jgi:hypothetical protein